MFGPACLTRRVAEEFAGPSWGRRRLAAVPCCWRFCLLLGRLPRVGRRPGPKPRGRFDSAIPLRVQHLRHGPRTQAVLGCSGSNNDLLYRNWELRPQAPAKGGFSAKPPLDSPFR
jgi:hypothetical protein